MSKKRVLWLFNHTSLRKFEVPLLIEMGYEVFCPKIWSLEFGDYSASITYEFDASLSIPEEDLEKLNQIDFYRAWDRETIELVNQYFDIAFCAAVEEPLKSLALSFCGVVVIHWFGWVEAIGATNVIFSLNHRSVSIMTLLKKMGNRLWFAPAYDNLSQLECSLFQNRTIHLPIGMKFSGTADEWRGGDSRILFICPKIRTNDYYQGIYEKFKKDFYDIPHVIGGAQPQPVLDDPTVKGFLSDEMYKYNMLHLSAMYYHCTEPYHLQYHPLEAVNNGMPLVFMAGGMLDHLGGENLPGRCKTIQEAKEKIRRLAAGDQALIREITSSQKVLLEPFKKENCLPHWQEGMQRIEKALEQSKNKPETRKKLAVLMPAAYTGGVMDYSIRFALCLQSQIKEHGDLAEVVFAYPDCPVYHEKDYFGKLRGAGISLRSFKLEIKNREWIHKTLSLAGYEPKQQLDVGNSVAVFNDGINYFADMDYAIVTADAAASGLPFFLMTPHAVVAHDYIQRYVPSVISLEADGCKMANQRGADAVLVTSEPAYQDALAYAGIPMERIWLTPHLCEIHRPKAKSQDELCDQNSKVLNPEEYFVWSSNAAPHKNHLAALSAIEEYYNNGGTLECVMTGTNTAAFQKETNIASMQVAQDYVQKIRERLDSSTILRRHIHIMGNLPKGEYGRYLASAAFLFHPCYGDNGTYSVLDAAAVGTPSLCSDYPAMRYLADFAGVKPCWMNPHDSGSMADALADMEEKHTQYARELPDFHTLSQCAYPAKARELYEIIKKLAGI